MKRRWTVYERTVLTRLYRHGASLEDMAEALPTRSLDAIAGQACFLGLARKHHCDRRGRRFREARKIDIESAAFAERDRVLRMGATLDNRLTGTPLRGRSALDLKGRTR